MKNLVPHYINKIEGHGSLKVDFTENEVEVHIHEGERLFEGMMRGRNYEDAVFIPQRICGVCPTAHCMGSIKALENALDVSPSEDTVKLRRLLLCGQMIQSHALHLFFLALPDYLDVDSTLSLAETQPEKFQTALNLKKYGDLIVELIGGRPVHPITPDVGGFSEKPDMDSIEEIHDDGLMVMEDAQKAIKLFDGFDYPKLETDTPYMAIQGDWDYSFYHGAIASTTGDVFPVQQYIHDIRETARPYSTAKFSSHEGESFMAGALARLNIDEGVGVNEKTSELMDEIEHSFPSDNPYHNNLAQAVELMHFIEESIKITDEIMDDGLGPVKPAFEVYAGEGFAAVEAPRGTLYYYYCLDDDGTLTGCDIITPTAQNLHNLEYDANEALKVFHERNPEEIGGLLNMLVRAYDPCITCSVH